MAKKITYLILACFIGFLASCNKEQTSSNSEATTPNTEATTKNESAENCDNKDCKGCGTDECTCGEDCEKCKEANCDKTKPAEKPASTAPK